MATVNYSIGVSTAAGVQELRKLQNQLANTTSGFSKLKDAVVGFASAAFITSIYQMANELTDMASATGVSTQAILGFTKAVSANGGTMDGATQGVGRFVQAIESAASGSKETQDKFLQLGVSLQDLRTLSEEDLLRKTIKGLGETTDSAKRVSIGVDLFGKSFRSVNLRDVNDQLDEFNAKSAKSAAAIDAAGQTSQNFANAYKDLSTQVLSALKPISDLANTLMSFKDAMSVVIEYIVAFGAVILTFTALGKAMQVVRAIFVGAGEVFAAVAASIAGVGKSVGSLAELLAVLVKNIPGLGALAVGFTFLFDQVKKAAEELGFSKKATEDSSKADKEKSKAQREVKDALDGATISLNKQTSAYRASIAELEKKYNLDSDTLLLSRDQKALVELRSQAETAYLKEINNLLDLYKEKQTSGSESDLRMLPKIRTAIQDVTTAYQDQIKTLPGLVSQREKNLALSDLETFKSKQLADANTKLKSIQDEMRLNTMPELQRIYEKNRMEADATAEARLNELAAQRNIKREQLDPTTVQAYYDAARQGQEKLTAAQVESYQKSREFSTGWASAFNKYVEDATNAATQAQRVFERFTTGIEDLFVNFAKTGKFEFKNFLASITEELLRSQIKQLIASQFNVGNIGGGGAGGSILGSMWSGFKSLLGFANGGIIPTNGPVIVGERGPEVISGAQGRYVTPNNQLGTTVNYNITAVDAMSFKQMIARDPGFIHAVAQQGARTVPGVR